MKGFQDLDDDVSSDTDESYDDEVQYPAAKLTPTVAVSGRITGMTFRGNVTDRQNVLGTDGMDDDFSFILEDPSVEFGRTIEANERSTEGVTYDGEETETEYALARNVEDGEYLDYRFVGEDFDTDDLGDSVLLNFGSSSSKYFGSFTDTVTDDAIEVFQGGTSGIAIAQGLEVDGGQSAYYDAEADEIVRGLVEYPPNFGDDSYSYEDDARQRVPTTPVVHPDLRGEEVVLYMQYGDEYNGNRAHEGRVFLADADSITECTELTGGNEDHVSDVSWESLDACYPPSLQFETGSPDTPDDGDNTRTDDDFDLDTADVSDGGDGGDTPDKSSLTSEQIKFVDEVVKRIKNNNNDTSDTPIDDTLDDFDAAVKQRSDRLDGIDPKTARAVVEDEL